MSKANVFDEERPELPSGTRTFTHPKRKPITLTFTALGSMDQGRVSDFAQKMMRKYLGTETSAPEMTFPAVGGKEVVLSETMIYFIASMVIMQEGAEEAYDFEELAALGYVRPSTWMKICQFRAEVAEAGNKAMGEEDAGDTGSE